MTADDQFSLRRRDLLALIGAAAGGSVMYQAMTSLGFAQESRYTGPVQLEGDPGGTSVLVLGAGLAGLVAALELRKAGYQVQVLEYNPTAGGRCWTIRGGDRYTELGGYEQHCEFDEGLYINPGPWRIPYHHHAILDYCKRLNVPLEPFIQVNYNAYLHSADAFDGKPQRFRNVMGDFHGNVAELLAKATAQNGLDAELSAEDGEILLEALRDWGALDENYAYRENLLSSDRRGFERDPGGGLNAAPVPSTPLRLSDLLNSRVWQGLSTGLHYDYQSTLFQPVGGMDLIARALEREVEDLITYNAKVTAIRQDEQGVTATFVDARSDGGESRQVEADWCLCTLPLPVVSQLEMNVGGAMANAIQAVPYAEGVKTGLQFARRFWEEDDSIYGGITYTDLPIDRISYPSNDYLSGGKGVLLGAYAFGPYAYEWTSMPPDERVRRTVEYGAQIHPQYREEYENGISVGWHRVPFSLGCYGLWTDETREQHYRNLCEIDGRIALAGEHCSYLPGWQEGAILSALDAIGRIHERVISD